MRTGQMSAGVHRSASLVTRPHPHQPSSPNSLHCRESLLKLLLLHPPTLPADKNTLTLFFTFTCSLQPILKRVFIIMNESQGNTSIFNLRGKFLLGTFSAACSHRSSDFLLAPHLRPQLTRLTIPANDGPTPACFHPSIKPLQTPGTLPRHRQHGV